MKNASSKAIVELVAFDVSNATFTDGVSACTANVMYANEPGMTISFVD